MNNKQLLLIKHLLSVKHPFPSWHRGLIMGEYGGGGGGGGERERDSHIIPYS